MGGWGWHGSKDSTVLFEKIIITIMVSHLIWPAILEKISSLISLIGITILNNY